MVASWRSVLDALRIKVLVLPVGPISEEQFTAYLGLLRLNSTVQCASLTPTKPTDTTSSHACPRINTLGVFMKQVGSNAELYFQFLQSSEMSDDMDDFVDFQVHRRILAVLLICTQLLISWVGRL